MRKIMVTYKGQQVDAGHAIEKVREDIEKLGVKLDDLSDEAALFMAANLKQLTVPEFLGF